MAVTFDAVGPSSAGTASVSASLTSPTVTALSWSHTVATTGGAVVVVGVTLGAANSTQDAATLTVTYGGVAMTSLGKIHAENLTNGYVQMFARTGVASGSQAVAVTASTSVYSLTAGSVSFAGAGSVGTAVTNANATDGTAVTGTVTGTSASNMVVDVVCAGTGLAGPGTGTKAWLDNASGATGAGEGAMSYIASAAGAVSRTWTVQAADSWGWVGVEVQQAAAASTPPRPIRVVRQAVGRAYNY